MRQRLININFYKLNIIKNMISLGSIFGAKAIFPLLLLCTMFPFSFNWTSQMPIPSLIVQILPTITVTPLPSISNSTNSSQISQMQQMTSEAQNDISIAGLIISWSGFFLALIATAVAIAGFFGIREFRRIHQLRNEFGVHIQEVITLKKKVEEDLGQLAKRFESESQTFMEASYNFSVATEAYKIGDNIRAIEYYLRVLQLQQKSTLVMERLGRIYSNLDEMKQAVNYLEKALQLDSVYAPALRSLALCYRYADKEKAIEYLNRCLDINSLDYEALDFLGLFYRDQGLTDEAISYHEKALSIKKRPETEFYLSILYSQKGDKKRAKLMALNAEDDLHKKEHEERLRLVWKILIYAGVSIIENNEAEAYQLIQTAIPLVTAQRIYDEVTTHLQLLLNATGHKEWIPKFMKDLQVKQI